MTERPLVRLAKSWLVRLPTGPAKAGVGGIRAGLGMDRSRPRFDADAGAIRRSHAVAAFAFSSRDQNLTRRGEPERVVTLMVTAGFFPLLTNEPFPAGRGFVATDEQPGAEAVVVLSHEFWMRRFGGDPSVVGETVGMDGRPRVVVGVAPAGFSSPAPSA